MSDVWDESVWDAEDEDEQEDLAPSHEQLFFLIDASPDMLQPCGLAGSEDFEGKSWLEAAVQVAASIMRQKVIASSGDKVAVMLYGTCEKSTAYGGMESTWVLQELEEPGADGIQALENFKLSKFESQIGSAPPTAAGRSLLSAFWLAKIIIGKAAKGKQATLRILLFTRNQEPLKVYQKGLDYSSEWKQLKGHINSLREAHAALELYPMVAPGEAFEVQPFWRPVLLELRGQSDADYEEVDEGTQVARIQDLVTLVRSKAHRRRAVGSFRWQLGGGLEVAVKLFQMLQPQRPAAMLKVHGENNAEVKAVLTGWIDRYTGEIMDRGATQAQAAEGAQPDSQAAEGAQGADGAQGEGEPQGKAAAAAAAAAAVQPPELRRYYPKPERNKASRYPKVYVTLDEIRQIKGAGEGGMTLLGFKPLSCLKQHHQVRNCSFLYPDERSLPGSATAFIALHTAMGPDTMAICRLAANRAREPRLVALLPQDEAVNEDGWQVQPPGFNVVYLPFSDDIRAPEADASFAGTARHAASEEQVAAAEALLLGMKLGEDFHPALVQNPVLQRHYTVLEAKAAGDEPPLVEEAVEQDQTLPYWGEEEEEVEALAAAFHETCGLGSDASPAKATKRKAEAPPVDEDALAALDIEGRAAKGTLGKCTNDQLKSWLRAKGLKLTGNKGELVARIQLHLGVAPQ